MDLNNLQDRLNVLAQYNNHATSIIKKIQNLDNLTDNERIFLDISIAQNLTIMTMSEMLKEVSKTAIMANDIVDNLSTTTGSGVDIFINEFSTRSKEVMDKKLTNIKDSLNGFATTVNSNLESMDIKYSKENSKIKKWVSETITSLFNSISNKKQALLINFIVSIFGGFVAIKLYQMFHQYLGM